jgi:hypothetical protein
MLCYALAFFPDYETPAWKREWQQRDRTGVTRSDLLYCEPTMTWVNTIIQRDTGSRELVSHKLQHWYIHSNITVLDWRDDPKKRQRQQCLWVLLERGLGQVRVRLLLVQWDQASLNNNQLVTTFIINSEMTVTIINTMAVTHLQQQVGEFVGADHTC